MLRAPRVALPKNVHDEIAVWVLVLSIGFAYWPQFARVTRATTLAEKNKDYVNAARIIGLPGDTILIKNGHVFVNGAPLDEAYIHYPATYTYPFDGQPKQIPDGNYFVLGDNRPNSSDSHLGWVVPVDNLIGKAWISYWPPTDWGLMPGGDSVYAR